MNISLGESKCPLIMCNECNKLIYLCICVYSNTWFYAQCASNLSRVNMVWRAQKEILWILYQPSGPTVQKIPFWQLRICLNRPLCWPPATFLRWCFTFQQLLLQFSDNSDLVTQNSVPWPSGTPLLSPVLFLLFASYNCRHTLFTFQDRAPSCFQYSCCLWDFLQRLEGHSNSCATVSAAHTWVNLLFASHTHPPWTLGWLTQGYIW